MDSSSQEPHKLPLPVEALTPNNEDYFIRVSEQMGIELSQISLTARAESSEELRSRLRQEEAEAEFQRKMREVEAEHKRRIPYEPSEVMQFRLRREESEAESQRKMKEAEAESQRKMKEADAKSQQQYKFWNFLIKDASAYAVGILLVIALAGSSIFFLVNGDPSKDDKKQEFARSTLAIIGGAVAGYVFGKSGSSSSTPQNKD